MKQRLKNYFLRHTQVGLSSLGQLSRAPLASLMTCLVIGITLALPTTLFIGLKNAEGLKNHFQQTLQLTLYLKRDLSPSKIDNLIQTLKTTSDVEDVHVISPTQALKELEQQEGYENLVEEFSSNPLPWAIVVYPSTPAALDTLAQELKSFPEVDSLQMDKDWVNRLEVLIDLAHRAIYTIAIFLGFAVFLMVNNAIRTATQRNQKEIEIIKLIGGTHSFIRRPFLYAGVIYGLLGGIIAWQLVDIFLIILKNPIRKLELLYHTSFQLVGIDLTNTLILLGISVTLGFFGAFMAATRCLRAS